MCFARELHSKTKSELDELKEQLALTDDEAEVFDLLVRGKSNTAIANTCMVSTSTVSNRIKGIKTKYEKVVM